MKRIAYIVMAVMLAGAVRAQITDFDLQTTADRDLVGSSRYVGMAGAMAAVGGDPSAVRDNPAALGVYRRDELSLSLDYQHDRTQGLYPDPTQATIGKFSMGQLSWNFNFNNQRLHGVVSNNLMLGYHRLKVFDRAYAVGGRDLTTSQTDVMALLADGCDTTSLYSNDAWGNVDLPWLSVVGAWTGMIEPDNAAEGTWVSSDMNKLSADLRTTERGFVDEYSLTWGMNISNKVYVGADVSLRNLMYNKLTTYTEQFADNRMYRLNTYQSLSGVGVNASVGMLYRPTSVLRMGVALHTPSAMAISYQNQVSYSTKRTADSDSDNKHSYSESAESYRQPMRLVAGMALQLSQKGLLSVEYDLTHVGKKSVLNTDALQAPDHVALNTHWLKVGAEMVMKRNVFLDLGYGYKVRPSEQCYYPSLTTTRLDTEFRNLQAAHYITAGLSYRNRYVVVGAAYQCRLDNSRIYLHEQAEPLDTRSVTHKVVFTLAWHSRG